MHMERVIVEYYMINLLRKFQFQYLYFKRNRVHTYNKITIITYNHNSRDQDPWNEPLTLVNTLKVHRIPRLDTVSWTPHVKSVNSPFNPIYDLNQRKKINL